MMQRRVCFQSPTWPFTSSCNFGCWLYEAIFYFVQAPYMYMIFISTCKQYTNIFKNLKVRIEACSLNISTDTNNISTDTNKVLPYCALVSNGLKTLRYRKSHCVVTVLFSGNPPSPLLQCGTQEERSTPGNFKSWIQLSRRWMKLKVVSSSIYLSLFYK